MSETFGDDLTEEEKQVLDLLRDEAYARFDRYDLSVGYSAARVRVGSEILVAGPGVRVPDGLLARRAA